MQLIIIFILCFMATAKITIQGRFGKSSVTNTQDALLFNGMVFIFAALVFLKNAFNCSYQTILFGAVFGLFTVIFQICYIKALSIGNVSLTVMIVNLNMVIPITVSAIFYNEKISLLRLMGIILTFVSIITGTDFKHNKNTSAKWFALTLAATVANGCIGTNQKIFGNTVFSSENQAFVSWAYIFSTIITYVLYFVLKHGGQSNTIKMKPYFFLYALSTGVILSVYQLINTYAISTINGILFFPTYAGVSIILSTLSGVLLFKDKLSKKQRLSILTGILSVIIMNL